MKRLAVPLRTHPESIRSGRTGSAGTGRISWIASPISGLLASSRQTIGRFSSEIDGTASSSTVLPGGGEVVQPLALLVAGSHPALPYGGLLI